MHDIALLRQLTPKQLEFLIVSDPLIYAGECVDTKNAIANLKKLGIQDDLIRQLMLSWIQQLERASKNGVAHDYCKAFDVWKGTHLARDHAIRSAQQLLSDVENVSWFHWIEAGLNARSKKRMLIAVQCLDQANTLIKTEADKIDVQPSTSKTERKHASRMKAWLNNTKTLKEILQEAVCNADFVVIDACLKTRVQVKLTTAQHRDLREAICILFTQEHLSQDVTNPAWKFLAEHGSDSERRACLNAAAGFGDIQLTTFLSRSWNLPLTERHWKQLMAKCWYDQPDGGDSYDRVTIARELVALSIQHQPMLLHALRHNRMQALRDGEIIHAHEISKELGEPLTIEDVTRFLRRYENDHHSGFQEVEIPFASKLFIELVGAKS